MTRRVYSDSGMKTTYKNGGPGMPIGPGRPGNGTRPGRFGPNEKIEGSHHISVMDRLLSKSYLRELEWELDQ